MTLVLAIDTATEELAIGLGFLRDEGVHVAGETNLDVPRASLTHLVPSVMRLLEDSDLEIAQVDAVVVGRGPGSFTGVRIAVAAAKGIAHGLGAPLFGVGTLDAVAERFASHEGLVGVVGDAMRREVYPVLFRCRDGVVERLTPDAVSAPAAVAELWGRLEEPILLAGNGLRKYGAVFENAFGDAVELAAEHLWTPTGEALLQAAWRARAAGRLGDGDAATLLPVYTRLSDAEEAERVRRAEAGGTPQNDGAGTLATPSSGVAGPAQAGEGS